MYKKESTGKIKENYNTFHSERRNKLLNKSKSKNKNDDKNIKPQNKSRNKKIDSKQTKQFTQKQTNLNQLIEIKNKEIYKINEENKKNKILLLEKQKIIMESEAKILLFSKDINILKNKIIFLEEDNTNKEQKIKVLNDSLIEYNQKLKSAEELINFNNKIKENNINEKIDNYEFELNSMKNKFNELEIEKSKLILDNNNLLYKLENINKEKDKEIKIIKLLESLKDNNINKTSDESINITIENENIK
jgi:hypothetical protein